VEQNFTSNEVVVEADSNIADIIGWKRERRSSSSSRTQY